MIAKVITQIIPNSFPAEANRVEVRERLWAMLLESIPQWGRQDYLPPERPRQCFIDDPDEWIVEARSCEIVRYKFPGGGLPKHIKVRSSSISQALLPLEYQHRLHSHVFAQRAAWKRVGDLL